MRAGNTHLESPPAAWYSVGSQSLTCMSWRATLAGRESSGDHNSAEPRTPPSQSVCFTCSKHLQLQRGLGRESNRRDSHSTEFPARLFHRIQNCLFLTQNISK